MGKVTEPWDIGLMPAPENPPLKMLLIEGAGRRIRGHEMTGMEQTTEMRRRYADILGGTLEIDIRAVAVP